jgi:hypothetical protein
MYDPHCRAAYSLGAQRATPIITRRQQCPRSILYNMLAPFVQGSPRRVIAPSAHTNGYRKKIYDPFALYYVKVVSREGAAVNRDRIASVAHDVEWSKQHSE